MSSTTTNLQLTLPTGTEGWKRSVINGNMEKIDEFAGNIQSGLAIICNGDTHEYIPAGAYIYVYNNTHGLADGLYYNSSGSGRSANSQVTSSMCTAVSGGGLNALNSQIENLHGLSETKNLGASSDLNNCKYAGAYIFNTSTLNTPAYYGVCFVIATNQPDNPGTGWVAQFAFSTSKDWKLYMRTNINNSGWTAWKSITFA